MMKTGINGGATLGRSIESKPIVFATATARPAIGADGICFGVELRSVFVDESDCDPEDGDGDGLRNGGEGI